MTQYPPMTPSGVPKDPDGFIAGSIAMDLSIEDVKTCVGCLEEKPEEAFGIDTHSRDGRRPRCRDCRSLIRRAYYHAEKNAVRNSTPDDGSLPGLLADELTVFDPTDYEFEESDFK